MVELKVRGDGVGGVEKSEKGSRGLAGLGRDCIGLEISGAPKRSWSVGYRVAKPSADQRALDAWSSESDSSGASENIHRLDTGESGY